MKGLLHVSKEYASDAATQTMTALPLDDNKHDHKPRRRAAKQSSARAVIKVTFAMGVGGACVTGLLGFLTCLCLRPPTESQLLADWSWLPAWFSFSLGLNYVFPFLERFPNLVLPPAVRMLDLGVKSMHQSQVLLTINELGIADAMDLRIAINAQDLAAKVNVTSPELLFRLMRAASSFGVFDLLTDDLNRGLGTRFRHNTLSAVLLQSHPNSVWPMLMHSAREGWAAWGALSQGIQSGQVPFQIAHEQAFFDHMQADPAMAHYFSKAMAFQEGFSISALLTDFPFESFSKVLDIGGGHGSLLAAVLQKHRHLSGTLFDMPEVVAGAKPYWQQAYAELLPRAKFVGGSFFEPGSVPAASAGGSDLFILRQILHDWSDKACGSILRALRASMQANPSARLAIIESLPEDAQDLSMKYLLDLGMFVANGGKERSVRQLSELLQAASYSLESVHHVRGLYVVAMFKTNNLTF